MMYRSLFAASLLALCLGSSSFADYTIAIQDTTVLVGGSTTVDVLISSTNSPQDLFTFGFTFKIDNTY